MLPGQTEMKYISAQYINMPEVDMKSIEEILMLKPQLIIAGFYDIDNNSTVEKLGKRLSVPVIFINLSVDKLNLSYDFIGKLFEMEAKASIYSSYLKNFYDKIIELKNIGRKVSGSIYYTLGASGLQTDPSGSKHTEVFDFLDIPNAAKIEVPSGGHAQVNMEQVLMWNPDFIFTSAFRGKTNAYQTITTNNKWKSVNAVINNKVYKVPTEPFAWLDHPPSVNRILGIIWMCNIFYGLPDDETRNYIMAFYEMFYKYKLSTDEYESLFE